LPSAQADLLISNFDLDSFFNKTIKNVTDLNLVRLSANYITSDIVGLMATSSELSLSDASSVHFKSLMKLIYSKSITSRVAKDILKEVVFLGEDPAQLVTSRKLGSIDASDLATVVDKIISDFPDAVTEYRQGKVATLQFLIGQGMRASKGSAQPDELRRALVERIG
jgi:aspartyl-tRNA(Asn)/glutamyl-tRNA(Gln) amidotransferase subunit B